MRRAILLGVAACGRLNIDPAGAVDATTDTPALPATLVCSAHTITVPAVRADADLAIAHHDSGFTAAWTDPSGAVQSLDLDNAFRGTVAPMMPGPIDSIAGIVVTPSTTLVVTRSGSGQTIWSVRSGMIPNPLTTEPTVTARDPFVADAGASGANRAWLRGTAQGIVGAYVTDNGTLRVDKLSPTGLPVIALSAAENFGHGHITFAEDLGTGLAQCTQADMQINDPQFPLLGGTTLISTDCRTPRIISGPQGTDSILTVWATSTGEIQLRYLGSSPDLSRTLSLNGRAPKVAFDGLQFWVAWIEQESTGDLVRLAIIQQDGSKQAVNLPGWTPRGDEAFELVRRGGTVFLAVLGSDTLAMLETCP